ncbi:hypothetical protein GOP47_0027725 [Adiantum capillus-veneris]|nr:hypothetical protein GOP47_0027725 [Adiantum capillus-veneris]
MSWRFFWRSCRSRDSARKIARSSIDTYKEGLATEKIAQIKGVHEPASTSAACTDDVELQLQLQEDFDLGDVAHGHARGGVAQAHVPHAPLEVGVARAESRGGIDKHDTHEVVELQLQKDFDLFLTTNIDW